MLVGRAKAGWKVDMGEEERKEGEKQKEDDDWWLDTQRNFEQKKVKQKKCLKSARF